MCKSEFQKKLFLSSVPLVRLDNERLPTNGASGCLIDYRGKRVLLTVSHATGDQGNWAIEMKYVPGKGMCNHQLGAMNFLRKLTLSTDSISEFKDVDFSYVEVPSTLLAYRQEIDVGTSAVKSETQIDVLTPGLLDEPDPEENFGFCGTVLLVREHHHGQEYLSGEIRVYDGLRYLRTEEDYHFFELPFQHPGDEHFKGCSGAPIIDSSGRFVALVCGGCENTNEIWGISVKAYKTAIDILVDNVS